MNRHRFGVTIESPHEGFPLHTEVAGSAPDDAFGPFRILHQIGAGVLGPVFRAYDSDRGRLVTVKRFRLDLPPQRVHRLVAAFERLISADLTHSVLAAPLATGTVEADVFLVQEYCVGESLDIVIRDTGAAPVPEALRTAARLADALDFAARVNVTHGALHPRDVVLSSADTRVTGIGVVRALEQTGAMPKSRRPYDAPERVAGVRWDRRADIFSLAALTHDMLWARCPAGLGREAADSLTGLPGANVDRLRVAFARGLAEDPAERYETAREFAEALTDAFRGVTMGNSKVPVVGRQSPASPPENRLAIESELSLPLESSSPADRILERFDIPDVFKEPSMFDGPETFRELEISTEVDSDAGDFELFWDVEPVSPPLEEAVTAASVVEPAAAAAPVVAPAIAAAPVVPPPAAVSGVALAVPVVAPVVAPAPLVAPAIAAAPVVAPAPTAAPPAAVPLVAQPVEIPPVDPAGVSSPPVAGPFVAAAPAVAPVVRAARVVAPPAAAPVVPQAASVPAVAPIAPAIPVFTPDVATDSSEDEPSETHQPPMPLFAVDQSRWTFAPLLLALIVGLAVGFAGGYGVGMHDRAEPSLAASAALSTAPEPTSRPVEIVEPPVRITENVPSKPDAPPSQGTPDTELAAAAVEPAAAVRPPVPVKTVAPSASTAPLRSDVKSAPGRLLIRSLPAGARVYVNGRAYGRTPATVRDLARGPHRVRVTHDDYTAQERRVVITAARPSQSMMLTLPRASVVRAAVRGPMPTATTGPAMGELSVESRPPGASVFVDGRPVGTTPMLLPAIPAGEHAIRLERDGSRTWSSSFRVVANERNRVTASLR